MQNEVKQADTQSMDFIARVAFKNVYPSVANYIVMKYRINRGWCLDLGSGPAYLAIAMARITSLNIVAMDVSADMAKTALANITDRNLCHRIVPAIADVHAMPFPDSSFDIIVSRGSIFFWDDRPRAFREIYRVLKPGGVAFCGGGMGSEKIRREADTMIMTDDLLADYRRLWQERNRGRGIDCSVQFLDELKQAGVPGAIDRDCQGTWLEIKKDGCRQP
jgi:ubiquinone/menaquinone biosynthesis C-methylase UbiE